MDPELVYKRLGYSVQRPRQRELRCLHEKFRNDKEVVMFLGLRVDRGISQQTCNPICLLRAGKIFSLKAPKHKIG